MPKSLYTVLVFAKLNTKRFFRDRLALFFTVAFPLIFLFVFGGIFGSNSNVSFKVALINNSDSEFARRFVDESKKNELIKIDDEITSTEQANEKMNRGEIDAAIVLPENFGDIQPGKSYPSGEAKVLYSQNNEQAGQTLTSVLQTQFQAINGQFVNTDRPFTVESERTNERGLSGFDYTFAGLLGFAIIGLGIFGPVNVFPELKKQGILRRLHTTPLKVWQYFLSNALSQAVVGLFTMAVLFTVAIIVFKLNVVGSYLHLIPFLILSIITILGIGLAIGGWASNERQAAPLSNIVVFPMMFLSGTFFPRFLMPEWLQSASFYLPLTPVIDGIRLIANEGKSLTDIWVQVALLAIWALIIYIVAFRVFRWE